MGWTPTGTGHELTIQDGRIVARNAKGRILVNVPAKVKKTEAYEQPGLPERLGSFSGVSVFRSAYSRVCCREVSSRSRLIPAESSVA